MLSLEGPDPYSQAGGLGVRARELCRALVAAGIPTTLVFVGDPALPGEEVDHGVRLLRFAQAVSARHPAGVYAGEDEKIADLETWVPDLVAERIVRPAAAAGRVVAVLCEEWQTARLACRVSDLLWERGLRDRAVVVWNANNQYGFNRIDFGALGARAGITTVSRYMKQLMWRWGVDPVVIPNGVPESAFVNPDPTAVDALRAAGGPCLAVKRGRFTPDKRWLQAVDAVAVLRRRGVPARLLMRGGIEPHGAAVLHRAGELGLGVRAVTSPVRELEDLLAALRAGDEPLIDLRTFLPDAVLPVMDVAATGVLANSGHEPFGLVGLEAMAAGGVAFVGGTGEDYATPYVNCIVVEGEGGDEVALGLEAVANRPALAARIRGGARASARGYAWPVVVDGIVERLRLLALRQGVAGF